ncbi:MAG: 3-oxoacyl-[acyl-carrier-protein] synthase III C-terminal domain-containing protein, partial [Fusobacteriaceae bacterium]
KGAIKKGDMVAMTGFGGGLTFGSLIMKWAY